MYEASIHHEQCLEASQTQGTRRHRHHGCSQIRSGQRDVTLQAFGGPDDAARSYFCPADHAAQGEGLATEGMPWVNDRDDGLGAHELGQRGNWMGWVSQCRSGQ
jgi:hypothetical protein